jgi:hypothetical protein
VSEDRLHFVQIRYKPEGGEFTRELTVTLRDDPKRGASTVRVAGLPNIIKVTKESYTVGRTWTEKRVE